jgi:ribosome-binding factor A
MPPTTARSDVSRRTERVAEQVRFEIARILREEATDARLRFVTILRVELGADLGSARLYCSDLRAEGDAAIAEVGAALAGAVPFLRRRLAASLALRRVPELRFQHDPSLAEGARTLALLEKLHREPR